MSPCSASTSAIERVRSVGSSGFSSAIRSESSSGSTQCTDFALFGKKGVTHEGCSRTGALSSSILSRSSASAMEDSSTGTVQEESSSAEGVAVQSVSSWETPHGGSESEASIDWEEEKLRRTSCNIPKPLSKIRLRECSGWRIVEAISRMANARSLFFSETDSAHTSQRAG